MILPIPTDCNELDARICAEKLGQGKEDPNRDKWTRHRRVDMPRCLGILSLPQPYVVSSEVSTPRIILVLDVSVSR